MTIVSKHEAEHYVRYDGGEGWKVLKDRNLRVIRERMSPGEAEGRHRHMVSQRLVRCLASLR